MIVIKVKNSIERLYNKGKKVAKNTEQKDKEIENMREKMRH